MKEYVGSLVVDGSTVIEGIFVRAEDVQEMQKSIVAAKAFIACIDHAFQSYPEQAIPKYNRAVGLLGLFTPEVDK